MYDFLHGIFTSIKFCSQPGFYGIQVVVRAMLFIATTLMVKVQKFLKRDSSSHDSQNNTCRDRGPQYIYYQLLAF